MKREDREFFMLWSERDDYQKRLEETERVIQATNFKKPLVSFSGGKDSTVTCNLFCKYYENAEILHWDYGRYFMPDHYRNQIKKIMLFNSGNIRIETSEKYETQGRNAENILGTDYMGKLIPRLKREGYDVSVTGIRNEESKKRSFKDYFQTGYGGLYEFCPIVKWRTEDVWAYMISNNLTYLSYYDEYSKILPILSIRFVTIFDPEFDKFGNSNVDGVLNWRVKHNPSLKYMETKNK